MNSITKAVVSNKLSSVGKSLGLDSDSKEKDNEGLSAKELRKFEEENAAAREKRKQQHAKRNAEREKKRDEIRTKYGLKEGKSTNGDTSKTAGNVKGTTAESDEKQCHLM